MARTIITKLNRSPENMPCEMERAYGTEREMESPQPRIEIRDYNIGYA